jgi:hypothetical protein
MGPQGEFEYQVESVAIVEPDQTEVLKPGDAYFDFDHVLSISLYRKRPATFYRTGDQDWGSEAFVMNKILGSALSILVTDRGRVQSRTSYAGGCG